LLTTAINYSQIIIYEESYEKLPFPLRIDNSGIYSIASFDIENDVIYFSSFNSNIEYEFNKGKYSENSSSLLHNKDFVAGFETNNSFLKKEDATSSLKDYYTLKKNFRNGKSILKDAGGNISGSAGEEIKIIVPDRNQLIVKSNLNNSKDEFIIDYPSNLACADLIGIDKSGNVFIAIEKYLSEIPIKVEREVIVLSETGKILSLLQLPSIKYLYTTTVDGAYASSSYITKDIIIPAGVLNKTVSHECLKEKLNMLKPISIRWLAVIKPSESLCRNLTLAPVLFTIFDK